MAEIDVSITPDRLKAYLTVPTQVNQPYPTRGDLADCLRKHGIVFGVKEDAFDKMFVGKIYNERILVAEGEGPQTGEPASLMILFDISSRGKPHATSSGNVDMRDLQLVINVKAGQELVKKIPATKGVEGRSVFGECLASQPGPDIDFKNGKGTRISQRDANVLEAAIDGAVVVGVDGCVEVITSEVIKGDIDYTTGNINFSGDLMINGSVRAGFSVSTQGNLRICGSVEESAISCTGDLEIVGGAVGGGEGTISCGGFFKARHVERFTVKAGKDVYILEDAIHSAIKAQGRVRARQIIGGSISASESIDVEIVGAAAESRTTLDAGSTMSLLEQKSELQKELAEVNQQLISCKQTQFDLVRTAMNESGTMNASDEKRMESLWTERLTLEKRRLLLSRQLDTVDEQQKNRPSVYIKIGKAFPNTVVRFGSMGKMIKTTVQNVLFTVDEDRIKMASFS